MGENDAQHIKREESYEENLHYLVHIMACRKDLGRQKPQPTNYHAKGTSAHRRKTSITEETLSSFVESKSKGEEKCFQTCVRYCYIKGSVSNSWFVLLV